MLDVYPKDAATLAKHAQTARLDTAASWYFDGERHLRLRGNRPPRIVYVRVQCQYLESLYAEHVKIGLLSTPFEVYAAGDFAGRPVARHPWLDYGRVFAPWRAVFGDRVAVTPFEPSRLPGGLVAHFLGLLGCGELAGAMPDIRAITRVGAKELEVRRLTLEALRRTGRCEPWQTVKRLRRLSGLLPGDRPFTGWDAGQAQDLMNRFATANQAFARDYGISAEGVLFEDSPVNGLVRPNVARWSDLTSDERAAVREYVREVVGVDPAPRSGRGAVRTVFAPRAGVGGSSDQAGGRSVRCRWAGAGA